MKNSRTLWSICNLGYPLLSPIAKFKVDYSTFFHLCQAKKLLYSKVQQLFIYFDFWHPQESFLLLEHDSLYGHPIHFFPFFFETTIYATALPTTRNIAITAKISANILNLHNHFLFCFLRLKLPFYLSALFQYKCSKQCDMCEYHAPTDIQSSPKSPPTKSVPKKNVKNATVYPTES